MATTFLVDKKLVLGDQTLNSETLKVMRYQDYVPDSFNIGNIVWLDGIECVVIAKDITISDCSYRNIAIDRNYDLGWYCKYIGDTWGTKKVDQIKTWVWGGYGTSTVGTLQEVGFGYQNTIKYLGNSVNGTNVSPTTDDDNTNYPSLYRGLNDFRNGHSDKWFLPSSNELGLISQNFLTSYLTFNPRTGAPASSYLYWSSSANNGDTSFHVRLSDGDTSYTDKYKTRYVRLCRVF